jgi:hypothetical protein
MKREFLKQIDNAIQKIGEDFREQLRVRLPNLQIEFIDSKYPSIRIPESNDIFGDIEISVSIREFYFRIGSKFHTHFDIEFSSENAFNNNSMDVIDEVIEFIKDIIEDKVYIKVKLRNEREVYTSVVYEDSIDDPIESMGTLQGLINWLLPSKEKSKEKIVLYTWSGKVKVLE